MRRLHAYPIGILLCLFVVNSIAPAQTRPGLKTYKHHKYKFTLQYPDAFQRNKDVDAPGLVLMLLETKKDIVTGNHVQVIVQPAEAKVDLPALARSLAESLKKRGAKDVAAEDTKLAGDPAKRFTYIHTVKGDTYKFNQVVCIHEGRVFVVTIAAAPADYDAMLPAAQGIVDSFQWMSGT